MSPHQIAMISGEAPAQLRQIMVELEPRIMEAAAAALEASQESDDGGKPKVAVNLKVVIDLTVSPPAWSVEGSVGVRYKVAGDINHCEETPELMENMGKGRARKGGENAA